MPSFARAFLRTSIPFGILMGLFVGAPVGMFLGVLAGIVDSTATGILVGLVAGLLVALFVGGVSGLFFGLIMAAFVTSSGVKQSATPAFEPGEHILKEGGANHFVGWEGVGGWLYLTDRRLIFKSHAFNVQVHELSIPLNEIASASPRLTAGVIPNGLLVRGRNGAEEQFVVEYRNAWVAKIVAATEHRADA